MNGGGRDLLSGLTQQRQNPYFLDTINLMCLQILVFMISASPKFVLHRLNWPKHMVLRLFVIIIIGLQEGDF